MTTTQLHHPAPRLQHLDPDTITRVADELMKSPVPARRDLGRYIALALTKSKERADARTAGCSIQYLRQLRQQGKAA
jgi:hypothetical protein